MSALPILALGGGVLGLLKAYRDQQNEKGDRELAAITARYSPWTGMRPQPVKTADYFGSMAEGALGGASFGQNVDAVNAYQDNMAADTDLKRQQAVNEKNIYARMLNAQREKNMREYGFAVTDEELARDYEDDISQVPTSSWHPPMAKPKR